MTAKIDVKQNAAGDGWDVRIKDAEDVVVRTAGPRITVAVFPDDDDSVPLDVTLGTPQEI